MTSSSSGSVRARRIARATWPKRPARRTSGPSRHDGAAPAPDLRGSFVFAPSTRRIGSVAAVVTGVAIVAASGFVPDGPDQYLAALVLAAAPFATCGLFLVRFVIGRAPAEYRPFWRWWFAAALTAYAAGSAALAGVLTHTSAPLALAALLLVAAVPLWCAASLRMLRAQAGRRAVSVDILGSLTALVLLGTPAVLVFAEPLVGADHPAFVAPFVASIVLVPAGVYLSLHGLTLVPQGERATQGIAMALGGAFALNATVQIAQILSDFTLPLPLLILFQVLNMGLLMAVPLWAHRRSVSVLDGLLPEHQVRRAEPLAIAGTAILPILAAVAWFARDDDPWRLVVVLAALVALVVLGVARQAVLTGETRRLYAELEQVAEERRLLLASLVRALEDDRHRMAAELHVQAVESFVAMGALVQTAYGTLPPDTARSVKEAIAHLQDDLGSRADALRRLTAAVRPPAFGSGVDEDVAASDAHRSATSIGEGALATALRASAGEAVDPRAACTVEIDVDPELELDWSTTTIVYRIVQEAVRNAADHGAPATIDVLVAELDGSIEVRVIDDGIGFDPAATSEGAGVAGMRLFAQLGNGDLHVDTAPGAGTTVRAVLSSRPTAAPGVSRAADGGWTPHQASARPRLLVVAGDDPGTRTTSGR